MRLRKGEEQNLKAFSSCPLSTRKAQGNSGNKLPEHSVNVKTGSEHQDEMLLVQSPGSWCSLLYHNLWCQK